jgi:biopolymer transport protein ExbD
MTWTGLDPELNFSKTEDSFRYKLNGDSLQIWYGPENRGVYLKTKADNFHEYFLTKGNLKLELPSAENVKRTQRSPSGPLDIRIGFRDEKVILFVDDIEMEIDELDRAIKKIVSRRWLVDRDDISCQLFIDKNVICDFTFRVLDRLRANNIRRIYFISKTDQADPNTRYFLGLLYFIQFD